MMMPEKVIELVKSKASTLNHNHQLLDIYDGNLIGYLLADLRAQLSDQAFKQQMFRMSPINMLPKIIDKLTNIYQTGVTREVVDGNDTDAALLDWYSKGIGINEAMNNSNEIFNLTKSALLYPYVNKGKPHLRTVLNDRFVLYSDDPMAPEKPTSVIILADKVDNADIFWTWDAETVIASDSNGKIRTDLMLAAGNPEGVNPFGRLPFVYVNESKHCLYPTMDTDLLTMIKLLPIMLSDLNLAAMFQCFSILYTIDVNDSQNLVFAPNAVWPLKSDPTTDKRPEIGNIKPTVDYDQVLNLIQSQLSVWLSTKGIRAGSVGVLTQDNFASGISKLIDEMDTFEARQKQVTTFKNAENELWDLLLNVMHPYWSETGKIDNPARFTPTAMVTTKFAPQLPMQQRGQVVRDLKDEYAAGFITRRGAVAKLNPDMTDAEIDELLRDIDEGRGILPDHLNDGSATENVKAAENQNMSNGVDVQKQALNGAQVEAMKGIVESVAAGLMPKDTAKATLKAAFNLDDASINDIVDPVESNSIKIASAAKI